jgi:CRP-like cAMP-binding protein
MNKEVYKKGEIVFRQGDLPDSMYDINSGSVGIYADYGTPKQKLLTKLGEERIFGEMGLIENRIRSATAVALESGTEIIAISPAEFKEYFHSNPGKLLMIMQNMGRRIRELTSDYTEACRVVTESAKKEESGEAANENLQRYTDEYRRLEASAEKH